MPSSHISCLLIISNYNQNIMTKLTILFGVLCLVRSAWANNPFPCPEDREPRAIDYSRAFYTSTQVGCQSGSEELGATANLWADIGVCFPLFGEAFSNIKAPMVLNSDHWCFGKDSYKAIPAFKEALEFKHINEIGKKKKIAGIDDVNTEEKNMGKRNKMAEKKKKQGTHGSERALTLAQSTNFYVLFMDEDLELISEMNMYLGCEHFCADGGLQNPVPIQNFDNLIHTTPFPVGGR
jgi:hypothetical protein